MRPKPLVLSAVLALISIGSVAQAGDLKIPLPKRDTTTPVQKLNRDGVKALNKHKLAKARQLFYKAYLLDPDDPFTLNNLGYISEMNGDIERAQRYYDLAAENTSDATIDRATLADVKGKKVSEVAGHAGDTQMQVNRYNVLAMGLLMKDRAPEADLVLQKALKLDPKNPFTLNNMGFAKEKEGEYEQALTFYSRAYNTGSEQKVIVSANERWRGRRISDIAHDNVNSLRKLMEKEDTTDSKVARLNLQGVSAINRNDRATARQDFERAYKLDPNNAFTLNNMGYVAEMDGDRETADFYYGKAQEAEGQNKVAAVATRKDVEGKPIRAVAEFGDNVIATRMEAERLERAREGGPILLRKRTGGVVIEPDKPPTPLPDEEEAAPPAITAPLQPLPDNQQPPAAQGQPTEVVPPLPENQQPNGQQAPLNPGNVLPPLPDNNQPPAAQPNAQPPAQPNTQAQPASPKQGAVVDGVIQPLPEKQQPDATKPPAKPKPPQ